jgi:uncharacterized membrane protein
MSTTNCQAFFVFFEKFFDERKTPCNYGRLRPINPDYYSQGSFFKTDGMNGGTRPVVRVGIMTIHLGVAF